MQRARIALLYSQRRRRRRRDEELSSLVCVAARAPFISWYYIWNINQRLLCVFTRSNRKCAIFQFYMPTRKHTARRRNDLALAFYAAAAVRRGGANDCLIELDIYVELHFERDHKNAQATHWETGDALTFCGINRKLSCLRLLRAAGPEKNAFGVTKEKCIYIKLTKCRFLYKCICANIYLKVAIYMRDAIFVCARRRWRRRWFCSAVAFVWDASVRNSPLLCTFVLLWQRQRLNARCYKLLQFIF